MEKHTYCFSTEKAGCLVLFMARICPLTFAWILKACKQIKALCVAQMSDTHSLFYVDMHSLASCALLLSCLSGDCRCMQVSTFTGIIIIL